MSDPRVSTDADGVTRKKRGRKKGTKAQAHWKKPGPKPGGKRDPNALCIGPDTKRWEEEVHFNPVSRAKLAMADKERFQAFMAIRPPTVHEEIEQEAWDDFLGERVFQLNEEEAICWVVQMTYKKCMESDDAVKWIESDTLERCKLEGKGCWRDVSEDDNFDPSKDEVIPIVCIYTRKRCGRFKCRAVALGNRQTCTSADDIYSPTISHACNRYLLTDSASKGHHILQFDITLAFINSVLDLEKDRVFCKLPKHWGGDRVRLLRALYGLKISPRRWYDTYRKFLESRGWTCCPTEPGLFRLRDMCISVYVDDTLISGPDLQEMRKEMKEILKHFAGEEVPPTKVHEDGTEERDLLGSTLLYNQKERTMKIHMKDYINKMLKKFNMEGCGRAATPCAPYADLSSGKPVEGFPMRQLVGTLLWLSVMCRPDISYACQRVAQFADKPNSAAIAAAKRIVKYLAHTPELGINYSPLSEEAFRETYQTVLDDHNKENPGDYSTLPDHVSFSDSDFGGCSITLRSTSGSCIYYKGTAIAWSSKKQGIRALSTAEAEYCGMYDAIRVTQSHGFLNWFMGSGAKLPLMFVDNQSALAISKSKLVTKKSKHFALRYMLVRDHFRSFGFCPSHLNLADPFTKGLPAKKYRQLFDHTSSLDEEHGESHCAVALSCIGNPLHSSGKTFRGGGMLVQSEHVFHNGQTEPDGRRLDTAGPRGKSRKGPNQAFLPLSATCQVEASGLPQKWCSRVK